MNKIKKYLPSLSILIVGLTLITFGCLTNKVPSKEPVYVEYFKQGQILMPDIVCADTLIVTNADGLNKAMGLIEQGIQAQTNDFGDYQYDSTFHQYCTIK